MNVEKIIATVGGPQAVGAICGVSRQAVVQWSKVPAEYVLVIARKSPTPITPHEIRADLYPHPMDGLRHTRRYRARRNSNGVKPRAS